MNKSVAWTLGVLGVVVVVICVALFFFVPEIWMHVVMVLAVLTSMVAVGCLLKYEEPAIEIVSVVLLVLSCSYLTLYMAPEKAYRAVHRSAIPRLPDVSQVKWEEGQTEVVFPQPTEVGCFWVICEDAQGKNPQFVRTLKHNVPTGTKEIHVYLHYADYTSTDVATIKPTPKK